MRMFLALVVPLIAVLQQHAAPLAPRFENGEAQPVFPTNDVVRHNVWVTIPNVDTDRDGEWDRVRLEVHRPSATEHGTRLPVVLIASPYSGGTLPYPRHDVDVPLFVPGLTPRRSPPSLLPRPDRPRYDGTEPPIREIRSSGYESYFLPRGFTFVYANSLGTGQSTGCPTIGGREESLAIEAAIDWMNGRGRANDETGRQLDAYWTTGATTMIGTSYDGTLPIGAATLGIDGLKAIVPVAGVSSYYDHRRSYGTVINSNPVIGTDADTLFDNILSRKHPEVCAAMRAQIAHGMDRDTGDYNPFWDERNYVKAVSSRFRAAVLIQHGLNDLNTKPRHAARLWQALVAHHVPAKIWWHQGGHGDRANQVRQDAWRTTLNRFWTHHLFGVSNGVMDGPKALVERENQEWVAYDNWPVPSAARSIVGLVGGDGDGPGALVLDRTGRSTRLEQTLVDDSSIDAEALAAATTSPNRLVFQTPALTAPVHVSGIPDVALRLSFSAPAAIVSAMLIDYRASGAAVIVSRGWADPQNRESIERTVAVEPGVPYTIAFELQPHDYVFPAGSRVGLMVLSSDRLFTLRPPPGTRLTLRPADSSLTLPVVGGRDALAAALVPRSRF